MSAFANSAAPAPAPERVAPHHPPTPGGSQSKKWLVIVLVIAALAAGAMLLLRPRKEQRTVAQPALRTYKVVPLPFQRTVRVAGTTSARNFANIVAPMMRGPDAGRNLTLISLAT